MFRAIRIQTAVLRNFCAIGDGVLVKNHSAVVIETRTGKEVLLTLQKTSSVDDQNALIVDVNVAKLLEIDPAEGATKCRFLSEDELQLVKHAKIKPATLNDFLLISGHFDHIQRIFISQIIHCQLGQKYILWINKSLRVHFTFECFDIEEQRGRLIENSLLEVIPVEKEVKSNNIPFIAQICPDNLNEHYNTAITVPHIDNKLIENVDVGIAIDEINHKNIIVIPESIAVKNRLYNGCKILLDDLQSVPRIVHHHEQVNFNSQEIIRLLDNCRSIIVSGCAGSGKSTVMRDLFLSLSCVFLDDLGQIFDLLYGTDEIIFLLDNRSEIYLENPQLFE